MTPPTNPNNHQLTVTVGILTYRRHEPLRRTLSSVEASILSGRGHGHPWRFTEVLVVDNDLRPTAQEVVDEIAADGYPVPLRYVHEPTPGLAAGRNRALDETISDVLVFIDDDEEAESGWPDGLLEVMATSGAALVGGPVRTRFTDEPPPWARKGHFFDRDEPENGSVQAWLRSGNLAIDLAQINNRGLRFDPRFGLSGGEDVAFSRQASRIGLALRWSSTAVVTEDVGPERTTIRWVTKRERASTANWVRAELFEGGTLGRRPLIAARGGARIAQGLATVLAGIGTLQSSRVVKGLVLAARGVGSFQGLLDHTPTIYRSHVEDD